ALSRVASAPVPDLEVALADDPAGLADVLASILPDADRQLVLLIDQFEEAFTLSDHQERDLLMSAIIETLDDPAGRLRVVVTARADFLGPILDHPTVGAAVRDHSRLVTPLEPGELHVAIVGPAETSGVAVESALATALVSDATRSPGSLPLLQYSLTELYEHRTDGTMTIDSYHRLGGMGAVLSQRAEEIYSGLDPEVQAASRRLFSRLIAPGEGVEDTRRRARQSELVGVSTELLETYGAARLIAFDRDPVTREPTVEVAHETLIRQWPRLRGWIDEDRDGLRIRHHLTMAAAAWEKAERDDGELYRGARLETADEWAAEHPNEMSDGERAFLHAGTARRDADIDLERRRIRRLRSLLAAVGVVAVLALVAGLAAFAQRRAADENAAQAEVRRVTAESERAAAGEDPSLGLLLALEALRMEPSNEGLGAVQRAGVSVPTNWLGDIENGASYRRVAYLPDGTLLAVHEEALEVWDVDERVLLRDIALDAAPTDIDVSSDGSMVVVGAVDGSWRAFDIADFALTASGTAGLPDDGTTRSITVIRLGLADDVLALGLDDGRVEIHGLIDPDLDRVVTPIDTAGDPITASVKDIAFRADGKVFAAAWGLSADVQQFETTTESEPLRFEESPGSFVLVYDDEVLHTAFQDVWSFDSETGEPVSGPISGTRGLSPGVAYLVAPDTSHLMLVDGASLTTVDLADGSVSAESVPISTDSHSAIAPDGRTLAVATATGLSFWAMDGAGMFIDTVVPDAEANAQFHAISSDGSVIVQGGNVGDQVPTRIWRVDGPAPVLVLELPPGYGLRQSGTDVIRFHAEGDPRDRIELDRWNPATNDFAVVAVSDTASFGTVIPVFTPDGTQFLHPWGTPEGIVEVYDVASQQLVVRLDHVMEAAPAGDHFPGVPTFSADGRALVVPTFEDWVGVYEVGTWELIDLLEPDDGFQEIVFTPDGQRAITLSTRGLEVRDAADLRTVIEGPVISKGEATLGRVLEITTDGRYLKVARLGGAQLWDAERLEPIGAPFPDSPDQWAATLAADTNQLTTVHDRATLVWNIDLDTWPQLACFAAGRNLTREEWEEFGPGGDYHATCDRWPAG
ncbi:MAG: WD40 repeat domain-containing protein, partial [Ilumatobacteraceae bacterium]